jgi:hypothetical protein
MLTAPTASKTIPITGHVMIGTCGPGATHELRDVHRLGQQLVQLDHLDPALRHLRHEVEVIALGALDLQHVVEQQRAQLVGTEIMLVVPCQSRSSSSHRSRRWARGQAAGRHP